MDHKPLSKINDQSFPISSSYEQRIRQLKEDIAALKAENQKLKQMIVQMSKHQQQKDQQLEQFQQLMDTIRKHLDESKERQEKIIKYQKESAERQNKILEIQKESNEMLQLIHQSLSSGFFALIKATLTGNLFTIYKEMVKKTKKW